LLVPPRMKTAGILICFMETSSCDGPFYTPVTLQSRRADRLSLSSLVLCLR
jgi:hypothetical protein